MNRKHLLPAGTLLAALLVSAGSRLVAQTAAPQATPTPPSDSEETIVLSPFVVSAEEDQGYAAKATLAGTRIRTELKDVGASISVVTQKFLQDTNSTSAASLLVYTPNTEVAAQGGNFLGKGDGAVLTGVDQRETVTTRVRGLGEADNTRDFFLTDIPWDSYNTGRIDLQRGPNSILFGIGSPSGIVNASVNGAAFKDANKVEFQFGSFGSTRISADFNKVLMKDELALRVSLLRDDTKYRQEPAFKDDHRIFVAGKWDPSFLNKGAAHTSVRVNFEDGKIESNLPRQTPPIDAFSTWFNQLNKQLINPRTLTLDQRNGNSAFYGVGTLSASAYLVADATGENIRAAHFPSSSPLFPFLTAQPTTYDRYADRGHLPGWEVGPFKAKSITDPSIFNFYDTMLEGPTKSEFSDFNALSAAVSQTFLNDKVGFELAYDRQHTHFGGISYVSPENTAISIDIATELPFGVPNPDVARPFFISTQGGGSWNDRIRETYRGTVFGELNFADISGKDSILNKIFGRNTFTGLAAQEKRDFSSASYAGYFAANQFANPTGTDYAASNYNGDLYTMVYLGSAVTGNSLVGANLPGLQHQLVPAQINVRAYNNRLTTIDTIAMPVVNNAIVNGNRVDESAILYGGGNKTYSKTTSTAAVWQGYWLGGTIVPMFGYRTDKQEAGDAGNPVQFNNLNNSNRRQLVNIWDANWIAPRSTDDLVGRGTTARFTETTVHSKTYSLVTHLPNSWRDKLPGRMDFSLFYNQSENIQPSAGRIDVYGNTIGDPNGKTKEYGVTITALDDKVSLKVAHYETSVLNANVNGSISGGNLRNILYRGRARALSLRDFPGLVDPTPANQPHYISHVIYGNDSQGRPVMWLPDGPIKELPGNTYDYLLANGGHGLFGYTQAELDSVSTRQYASMAAWLSPAIDNVITPQIRQTWGFDQYWNNAGGDWMSDRGNAPSGLTITGDTVSEGYEFELMANPIKGLNVAVNVSKTSSKRTNLASSYVDLVEKLKVLMAGPAGDMRLWGVSDTVTNPDDRDNPINGLAGVHGEDGETVRGNLNRQVLNSYNLYRALEASDVPELRPWAANVIGDYAFQSGPLRGANVGGAYRWQSASIIGFPVILDSAGKGIGYDVEHPYKGAVASATDIWIGYRRKLTDRINWRVQLNVRNVFSKDELARVTVQPDGSPGAYRIPEPRTFTLTNTFEF